MALVPRSIELRCILSLSTSYFYLYVNRRCDQDTSTIPICTRRDPENPETVLQ